MKTNFRTPNEASRKSPEQLNPKTLKPKNNFIQKKPNISKI